MSLQLEIRANACRGCQLCVDMCPTDALVYDEATDKALVQHIEDCIACLSCKYICPSGAITHADYHAVPNFYRNLDFSRRIARFL